MVLERLPVRTLDAPAGTRNDREFERRYLEHLGATLDEIELFGVRVETYRPRAALSIAYISLNVTAEQAIPEPAGGGPLKFASLTHSSGDEGARATMRAETALSRFPRTLLRGQAGSGKSTLLRWITVTAARSGFTGDLTDWNGRIPFLIKLRSHAEGPLPQPEDLVQGPLAALMPPGWAHRMLSQGRALLLADGVDELPAGRRVAVRDWLRDLLAAYPAMRVVVSSRPAAAEARWLDTEGFLPAVLEPMGPSELRQLVRQWHGAIRHSAGLPCQPEELPRYEGTLLARLEGGAHLRALAATPLLAAMMCALNLDRATQLPRDRMGLYAAALELLLERRDAERAIPAYQEVILEPEQKVRILQDLAWHLTVFGRAEMARSTALSRVADKTAGMLRITAAPGAILEQLLQRTGVIREPVPGRIDFVHRTIQEYLAAAQAADNADMEPLIDRAHLDQWRETVIMAAGHANGPLRRQLLTGLLDRADAEPRHSRRLRLLITSCLETVPDISSELRDRIDTCVAGLIPPRTTSEARPLASAGEEILRRLPLNLDDLPVGEAVATVRTAWLINGSQALDRLARYARDPRTQVQDELIAGWSYFDPYEYASRVLADASLHNGRLTIDDPDLLPAVPFLRNLRDLRVKLPKGGTLDCLYGLPALTDLRTEWVPAAALPALAEHTSLRRLDLALEGIVDDVSPFLALPALRELHVQARPFHSDLSFVRCLPKLRSLMLTGLTEVEDFTPLISQHALDYLDLHDCHNLTDIDVLYPLTRLRSLSLGSPSLPPGSLQKITEAWPQIRLLQLANADWVTSLDPVTALPLEVLSIPECSQVNDIRPIASLSRLRRLLVAQVQFESLEPITKLRKLNLLNLWDHDRDIDLPSITRLPKLRTLSLGKVPADTDLTQLAVMRNLTIVLTEGQYVRGIRQLHRSTRITWRPRG